jgi:hypothetical protein
VSKDVGEVQQLLGSDAEVHERTPLEDAIADLERTARAPRELGP